MLERDKPAGVAGYLNLGREQTRQGVVQPNLIASGHNPQGEPSKRLGDRADFKHRIAIGRTSEFAGDAPIAIDPGLIVGGDADNQSKIVSICEIYFGQLRYLRLR